MAKKRIIHPNTVYGYYPPVNDGNEIPMNHTAQRLMVSEMCSDSVTAFARFTSRGLWENAAHFDLIEKTIFELIENAEISGFGGTLIVTQPPQTGKTTYISEYFTAWGVLFRGWRFILLSYAATQASRSGARSRDLVKYWGPVLNDVSLIESAAAGWSCDNGGGMYSRGVEGAATGKPADIIITDDPTKSPKEAFSKTSRENIRATYEAVTDARLTPGRLQISIIVMTRWAKDDLAGWLIDTNKRHDNFKVLHLPALATSENDQLGRKIGESIWPAKRSTERWESLRDGMRNKYFWHSLYQGDPTPEGLGHFKKTDMHNAYYDYHTKIIKYVDSHTKEQKHYHINDCSVFESADTALKKGEQNDFTVMGVWALTPCNDLVLLVVHRDKLRVPQQLQWMYDIVDDWDTTLITGIEDASSGTGLIQHFEDDHRPVCAVPTKGDKVSKAVGISMRFAAGKVYLCQGDWRAEYEEEMINFDSGEHDDQVDMSSHADWIIMNELPSGSLIPSAAAANCEELDLSNERYGEIVMRGI